MSYTPHSLLDASKLLADIANIDWATAHRFYRNLQADPDPWLPKSLGRNIWHAHPHYIARLLIALSMSESPEGATAAVNAVLELTPGGRGRYLTETDQSLVEMALTQFLIHADQADNVERVEFDPVEVTVAIVFKNGTVTAFSRPEASAGPVLSALARAINWRRYCDAPLDKVVDGLVNDEA